MSLVRRATAGAALLAALGGAAVGAAAPAQASTAQCGGYALAITSGTPTYFPSATTAWVGTDGTYPTVITEDGWSGPVEADQSWEFLGQNGLRTPERVVLRDGVWQELAFGGVRASGTYTLQRVSDDCGRALAIIQEPDRF